VGKAKLVNWQLKLKGFGLFDKQLDWAIDAGSSKVAIYADSG